MSRRVAAGWRRSGGVVGWACLCAAALCRAQEWDGKANGMREYPLGVLGGRAIVHLGKPDFEVTKLERGEAGDKGGLLEGDRIIAAGDKKFEAYDNEIHSGGKGGPKGLGDALDAALQGGTLAVTVLRGGEEKKLRITVPKWGSLGEAWPTADNPRLTAYRRGVCDHLDDMLQGKKGRITVYGSAATDITKAMAGLALLASGETRYAGTIRDLARAFAASETEQGSNWRTYYVGVFMSEYFLCTRDASVLPWLKEAVRLVQGRMSPEGFIGHGGAFPEAMYGRTSGFNPVGSGSLWFLALAARCGVPIQQAQWSSCAVHLGKSSGHDGAIGYCLGYNGGQDAHARSAQTLLGLCVANKQVTLRRSIGNYLASSPYSIREAHAYSAPSVLATFLALHMHDEKECRRQFALWSWYFTLAEQPDHSAAYIGGKRNNGGDEYLGMPHIMNAAVGVVLGAPKRRLFMYGGMPAIPGVAPGSLSPQLYKLVNGINKEKPAQTLKQLRGLVSLSPRGADAPSAVRIGRYVYREQVLPLWREVLEMSATGDLFRTQALFESFVQTCGRPPPLEKEIAYLEWLLSSPRGVAVRRRGSLYWSLVEKWSAEPRSRPLVKRRLTELGQDRNDLYGQIVEKTIQELEEQERQTKELDARADDAVEDTRKRAL